MIFNLKCLGIVLLILGGWFLMPSWLVRAALVPKEADKKGVVSVKELKELLGKDHLSDEVFEIRKRLGKTCKVTYYGRDYGEEPCFYQSWYKHGIDLKFNEKGQLDAIFLYSEGTKSIKDVFKQYIGELPNGLDFNDDPKDVVRKLGEPDEKYERLASYSYPKLGLNVNFKTVKKEGERSTISNVTIYLPEKD